MRVMVGMSGGVDSSVAALLLTQQGYDVGGATLRLLPQRCADRMAGQQDVPCGGTTDVEDARRIAARIGIDHRVLDFSKAFDHQVVDRFIRGYAAGLTPNPCVDCNRTVKFPALLESARSLGYDAIATGHYARIERDARSGRFTLRRAADPAKDQSYVLYALSQDVLAHTVLPLGGLSKPDVRRIARANGFGVSDKPESQDICFIRDGDYANFLEEVGDIRCEPGDIVDAGGIVLGRHHGLHNYTIGQRKGVEVTPISPRSRPYYVIAKDLAGNRLVVGHQEEAGFSGCTVVRPNWVSIARPEHPLHVQVKTRYRQEPIPATMTPGYLHGRHAGEAPMEVVSVEFEQLVDGVASGQACVFYRGSLLLGGGTIA